MMRIFKIIFFVVMISIVVPIVYAETNVDRINEYLLTSHILLKEESADYQMRIKEVSETKDMDALRHVALATVEKVVKDRTHLEFIIRDLQKLSQDQYAQKIGQITIKNLEKPFETLKRFRGDMKKARPQLNSKKKMDIKDYQKILKNHQVFLNTSKDATTSAVVWEDVKKASAGAYDKWAAHYQSLENKVNQAQENGENPEARLTKDETKFVKVFSRVKSYWAILEGTGR